MAYIARTDGGSSVLELRAGVLTDIHKDDRPNWLNVVNSGVGSSDPWTSIRYISDYVVNPGVNVQCIWAEVHFPAPYARLRLKEYAAALRNQKTEGGLMLPDGSRIDTSETSKAKIDQVLALLEKGWSPSVRWKSESGWLTLDLAAMTSLAQAVAGFEQACFAAEEAIGVEIDAGTITTQAEIDAFAWPA